MGSMGPQNWGLVCFSVFLLLATTVLAGNTTCASGQLDWYTSVVGETPCDTYQRLRQICNNDYQVPSFRPNTPGDNCDDQVSECCCNTVAFQLSMLCMNCQQDRVAGDQIGIDAGVGAYTLYRGKCGAGTNRSLPRDIQTAVCNKGIKLDNYLYGGWDDGSWFYVWSKENAERDHAVNNDNTFTHCPDQISPSPTPTPATTNAPPSMTSTTPPVNTTPASPSSSPDQSPTPSPQTSSQAASPSPSPAGSQSSSSQSSASNTTPGISASPNAQAGSHTPLSSDPSTSNTALAASSPGNTETGANLDTNATSKSTSHTGAIVGGVVGGIVVALAIAALLLFRRYRARTSSDVTRGTQEPHHNYDTFQDYPFHPNMASSNTNTVSGAGAAQRNFLASHSSPQDVPQSGWSEYSSVVPQSTFTSEEQLRHTDAGVVIPLARSGSGRLPPAYRSWEDDSNVGSDSQPDGSQVGGGMSSSSGASDVAPDPNMPLIPLRFEEKGGYGVSSGYEARDSVVGAR
ncbi:hypothetical protein C8Q79DRAFT_202122 [Trametes meyenii]|nr:hypothetical protein C8Q79DRAFT_202122 [Trametes meyenii]